MDATLKAVLKQIRRVPGKIYQRNSFKRIGTLQTNKKQTPWSESASELHWLRKIAISTGQEELKNN
jgi:hypothetical protein